MEAGPRLSRLSQPKYRKIHLGCAFQLPCCGTYIEAMAGMYFGEREAGLPARTEEELTPPAWRGIVAAIITYLRTGWLAESFPEHACPDRPGAITGSDQVQFYGALQGEHPEIEIPLDPNTPPPTVPALELTEFCHRHVSKPLSGRDHEFYGHTHYSDFSKEEGQTEFTNQINTIFRRQRLAYELQADGQVRRLLPPVLREVLVSAEFTSEDNELNRLLGSARQKFSSPDFRTRYDALKDLWDAFERLKTLEPPRIDKRQSSAALIARVSDEPKIRDMLDAEMRIELDGFGNGFFIRHANATQVTLQSTEEIDYLFHRLFAVIRLLLRSTGRGQ